MLSNKDRGTSVGFTNIKSDDHFTDFTEKDWDDLQKMYDEEKAELAANTVCKEHEWVEGFTPPTTTLNGKQYFRCKNCGQIKPINFHIKDNIEVIEDNKWEEMEAEIMSDPYPVDIFPEVTDYQLKKLHKLCLEKFGFPLDRFSAHIGRLLRKGIQEKYLEIKKKNS